MLRHFRQSVEEAKCTGNFHKGTLIHPEVYGHPPEVDLESEAVKLEDLDKEMAALDEE